MGKKSCATASNYHLQFTYQRLPIFSFLTRMNLQLNRHCKNTPLSVAKNWNCWKWMNFNEHNGQYVLLEPSDDRHLLSSGGEYIRLFCSKDQFNSRLRRKSTTIHPLPRDAESTKMNRSLNHTHKREIQMYNFLAYVHHLLVKRALFV